MKNLKTFAFTTAFAILLATAFTSCRKHKDEEDTDTTEAQDHALAQTTSNDVVSLAGEVSESGTSSSYRQGNNSVFGLGCCTVYRDTVRRVDSVVFAGTCLDGKPRSGALTFTYASNTAMHYRNPGFSCTVRSYNYVVNGNQVNIISKTITNTTNPGFNSATTNLTWSINGNISITKASGGTLTSTYNHVKTLLNTSDNNVYHGQSIPITWSLARVGFTGNSSGTTANGRSYTANITNQLVRDRTCSPDPNHPGHHPFIQGTIDFTPSGKATRTIDYGGGSCDLNATVTINGHSHNITLP
ncbi:MAG TPA: hypothetical protein VNY73_05915 [Bacteroidia bacterium]|nr:hypothetical protein [Bacteroidia bacterium]